MDKTRVPDTSAKADLCLKESNKKISAEYSKIAILLGAAVSFSIIFNLTLMMILQIIDLNSYGRWSLTYVFSVIAITAIATCGVIEKKMISFAFGYSIGMLLFVGLGTVLFLESTTNA
jgi:hypothetical protein